MFCSRILVAFDDSELAMKSLDKAIELAKTDSTIEVELFHYLYYGLTILIWIHEELHII